MINTITAALKDILGLKKSISEKHRCQLLHDFFQKLVHEMVFGFGQHNFNYFFQIFVFGGRGRGLLPGRALRNTMLHSCARIETCEKSCDEFLKDRCLENVTKHKTVGVGCPRCFDTDDWARKFHI